MYESKIVAALLVACLGALAPAVFAGSGSGEEDLLKCRFPEPPKVPDGRGASEAELALTGERVRSFLTDMQGSLDCLDGIEAMRGAAMAPGDRAALLVLYNNGVDQMHAVADAYNAQLERMREEAECGGAERSDHCVKFVPGANSRMFQGGIQN